MLQPIRIIVPSGTSPALLKLLKSALEGNSEKKSIYHYIKAIDVA